MSVQVDYPTLTAPWRRSPPPTDLQPVEGAVAIDGVTVRTVEPVDRPHSCRCRRPPRPSSRPGQPAGRQRWRVWCCRSPRRRCGRPRRRCRRRPPRRPRSCPARCASPAPAPSVEVPVTDIAAATTVTPDGADGFTVTVDAAALRAPFTGRRRGHPERAGRRRDLDPGRRVGDRAQRPGSHRRLGRDRGEHRARAALARPRGGDRLHRDPARR